MSKAIVYGLLVPLGVCIAATAFGSTIIARETNDYFANKYLNSDEKIAAYNYVVVSKDMESISNEMEEQIIYSNDEVKVLKKPDNESIKSVLESRIDSLQDMENSDSYIDRMIEAYTEIEILDNEYSITFLNDLESKTDYGERYNEIEQDIDELSKDLMDSAKLIQPDIENIEDKIQNYKPIEGWAVGSIIVGVIGTVVLGVNSIIFVPDAIRDLIEYNKIFNPKPRREMRKRNRP